jgi:hypothetical protein
MERYIRPDATVHATAREIGNSSGPLARPAKWMFGQMGAAGGIKPRAGRRSLHR